MRFNNSKQLPETAFFNLLRQFNFHSHLLCRPVKVEYLSVNIFNDIADSVTSQILHHFQAFSKPSLNSHVSGHDVISIHPEEARRDENVHQTPPFEASCPAVRPPEAQACCCKGAILQASPTQCITYNSKSELTWLQQNPSNYGLV
jgi:hypothetical protein